MVMVDPPIKTMLIVITGLSLLMLVMKPASRTDKSGGHRVLKLQEDSSQWFTLSMGVEKRSRCCWLDVNNQHICLSQKGSGKIKIRS